MFFIISKILSFLLNPFFWMMVLLIWAFITKNIVKRKRLILFSFLLLFVFGNGVIVNEVGRGVEKKWHNLPNEISLDTAVLLGGYCFYDESLDRVVFAESADRFVQALALYQSEEIGTLVISGGSGSIKFPQSKEAMMTGEFLSKHKFRVENLILESESRNTFENAINTKEIIGIENPNIVLITSAFHMKRAMKVFQKAGFNPTPYPTHFLFDRQRRYSVESFVLPSAKSFAKWELLIREWLGRIVYRIKGYL